MFLDKPKIAL